MITYTNQPVEYPEFSINDGVQGALNVLKWAYEEYGDNIVYACSFGIEGIVLIDLIAQVKPDAQIVFLDTNLHFKETYMTIQRVKDKYPQLKIELKQPKITLEEQAEKYGNKLWELQPNKCCEIRKMEPLKETLSGATAWISGLRREQSSSRAQTEFINVDEKFQSIKICPLIHWSWKDVWRYVSKYDLPYNPLHDQGYPSIGCEKCTVAAFTMDDLRSGRWQGQGKTECGLHG